MTSFILVNVAVGLVGILFVPGLLHTIIDGIRYGDLFKRLSSSWMDQAIAIDIFGNIAYASLLNAYFIKHGGYHFGSHGETVSAVLGQNQVRGTLTFMGKGLVGLLDTIQTDHCWISIKNREGLIKPDNIESKYTISFMIIVLLLLSPFIYLLL